MNVLRSIAVVLLATAASLAQNADPAPGGKPRTSVETKLGRVAMAFSAEPYRAVLESPGGELPFGLEIVEEKGVLTSWIINGSERIEVPYTRWDGRRLVLDIDHYDAVIEAEVVEWTSGARQVKTLLGFWKKRGRGGTWSQLPFSATIPFGHRFKRLPPPADKTDYPSVDGRWSVKFSSDAEPAIGQFKQAADGTVQGTFLTATGDYRYLAGSHEFGRLRLSTFDGAHAFLFDARMQSDGTLKGEFWSRDSWHETWTATKGIPTDMSNQFSMTRWDNQLFDLTVKFPDLEGRLRSLDDPEFQGTVRIIEIFGSWCPNCHDAARHLADLERKYRDRGLKVLGLAFELTGDAERDARQVRRFMKRNGVEYPVLLAGVADKKLASKALPFLDELRAYPTAIFINDLGEIKAVHAGFSGPATGNAFHYVRFGYIKIVEDLFKAAAQRKAGS